MRPRVRWIMLAIGLLLLTAVLMAQTPSPTCEGQVADDSRQLAAYLPQTGPLPTWQAQLSAIVTQVRVLTTRLDLKRTQVDQAETSLAQLLDQIRQLQQQVGTLQQDLDQARKTPPQPSN
jgi:peptidoglycan hydrolase CwlO-like protein